MKKIKGEGGGQKIKQTIKEKSDKDMYDKLQWWTPIKTKRSKQSTGEEIGWLKPADIFPGDCCNQHTWLKHFQEKIHLFMEAYR